MVARFGHRSSSAAATGADCGGGESYFAEGASDTAPPGRFLGPEWFSPQRAPVNEARTVLAEF